MAKLPDRRGESGTGAMPDGASGAPSGEEKVADSLQDPDRLVDRDLESGDKAGDYEIEAKIGQGGFGTVYRAVQALIGKHVAIKVLNRALSTEQQALSRFITEARAVNTIRHSGIVDIFSFGSLPDGRHYCVMELLEGVSVQEFLKRSGALEPPLVLSVMRGVVDALDAAHAKGIVHRDLKPDNIFLTFDAQGRPVPKLLDFGMAKLLGDAQVGHRTATGTIVGTPHYMAPEQCRGTPVDARTDVYALGVVCFEALSGHKPFVGDSILELLSFQVAAERPLLSVVKPELGGHFDEAIRKMMAIDKDDRPASAGASLELLADAVRAAGFDADSTPVVAERDRRPPAHPKDASGAAPAGSQLTSRAGSGRLATARTFSGEHRRSRTGPLLVAAALVGGVIAYLLVDPTDLGTAVGPSPDAGALVPAPPSASAAVRTSTAEDTITIRVETSAKGATAYLGDTELGPCPGEFAIDDPGARPVAITLKAPGYEDETVEVELADGQAVTIEPQPR